MEIIIILFVASIGIMASLSLAIRSAYFQNVKKDILTVTFLANEASDIMKNIRDTNIINGRAYDDWDGSGSAGIGQNFYTVDFNTLIASSVASIDDAVLQQNSSGFFLHDNNATSTAFKRMITTTAETSASTSVEVHIQWENKGNTYDYKLETILYDLGY